MMNLSYAPVPSEENAGLPNEAHLGIKIIELIKLTNDLEWTASHWITEDLELSILAFLTSLRRQVLTDHRVLNKLNPEPIPEDEFVSYSDCFIWIIENLSPDDLLNLA